MVSFEYINKFFKKRTENCFHEVWFHGDEFLEQKAEHGLCGKCASHIKKNGSGEWVAYRTATGEKL